MFKIVIKTRLIIYILYFKRVTDCANIINLPNMDTI